MGLGHKRALFPVFGRREEGRGGKSTKLLSSINGVSLVGFRRAKDRSSSHRRGVDVGT